MFIEWKDEKHSLGIPTIDEQHKELFLITNQLHEILETENYQKEAEKLLKRLYAYTSYHFASEEAIQKEYKFPFLDGHKAIHKSFKKKVIQELEGVRSNINYPLAPLQDFLIEWILKQIQGEDTKYAAFFKTNDIKPEVHFSVADKERNDIRDQWQAQKLALHIGEIDKQHKELIYILQQTNDLQHTSDSRKHIYLPVIIQKLFYYSQFHFSYEEEHMAKNNYPNLKGHQEEHKAFILKIQNFAEKYKQGFLDLTDEIILFLKDWTINHILQDDKNYKNFLVEKNLDH